MNKAPTSSLKVAVSVSQLALVQIIENGSDLALYLDGEYVMSADPGAGDSVETVEQVAASLGGIFGIEPTIIEAAATEDWQWYEVVADLINKGLIVSRHD